MREREREIVCVVCVVCVCCLPPRIWLLESQRIELKFQGIVPMNVLQQQDPTEKKREQ
jgi:hypothetical protein